MNEGGEQLPGEQSLGLIEEIKAKAIKKEAQAKEIGDQEAKKNIAENVQNFWQFFEKIPPERYSSLDTPEKLIETLNKAGGNFVNEGNKFSFNSASYQVFEIHPLSAASDEMLDLWNKKGYAMMSGTNFWDNPPQEGRLFIPAVYLVKKLV